MRREVWYRGHVQGVGFRYTAVRIARGFEVTGFVRNADDGRVQLVAEGDVVEIQAFLDEITLRMGHFIREAKQDSRPPDGNFIGFDVQY